MLFRFKPTIAQLMKVLIFGDVHDLIGEADIPTIEVIVDVVSRTDADLILQAGDLGGYRSFPKPVHWIFGNNDSIASSLSI